MQNVVGGNENAMKRTQERTILAKEGVPVGAELNTSVLKERRVKAARACATAMGISTIGSASTPSVANRVVVFFSYGSCMKILPGILLLCAVLAGSMAIAQERIEEQLGETTEKAFLGITDREMLGAISRARASLDQFLALADNPEPGMSVFKMKVVIRDGEDIEFFWVTPFRRAENGFEGVLANTPDIIRNVRLGETIRFSRDDVTDWGYVRNGRQVGSFTSCVLFKYLQPQIVDYLRRTNGFDC